METFEAIRTVLAVRSFTDRAVPDDVVQRIVEAGRLTASSSNGQPWHFIVVRDRDTLRKLGEALSGNGPYLAEAPLAIAVVVDRSAPAVSDASRAIQSMLLAAWADGVGGNWVGSVRHNGPVKPILGIPDDQDVPAVLALGYPTNPGGKGEKNRKPASEVIFGERWGQPLNLG